MHAVHLGRRSLQIFIVCFAMAAAPGLSDARAKEPPAGLVRLAAGYAGAVIIGADGNSLVWRDGTRMVYSDGIERTPAEQFEKSDLRDMMRLKYPRGPDALARPPSGPWLGPWFDPGRNRNEAFFRKMYGATEREVSSRLVRVAWEPDPGVHVSFTAVGQASAHLQAAAHELAALASRLPAFAPFLQAPLGGTFNWRFIGGTDKLSVHSFGAAIDINLNSADYWRNERDFPAYRNRVPLEIVAAFERHGFIWGGKWEHYDTMHFEYRPELLTGGDGTPWGTQVE